MDLHARAKDFPAILPMRAADRETEDFVVCLECGQGFDRRNVAHVLYHAEPGHDPLERTSERTRLG